jgi:hypothetical protein
MERTIAFLERLADELDDWARESRQCGWSTHQVERNQHEANECRREAAWLKKFAAHAAKDQGTG